jgi:hypothetical protein
MEERSEGAITRKNAVIDPDLTDLVEFISAMNRQNTAPVIAITGKERMSGKSTLAYWMGQLFSEYLDTEFTTDNFVWNGMEVIDKIKELPRYNTIILDEAGLDLYARRSMSNPNVLLNKATMVCGFRNQIIILCIPSLWDLEGNFRDRRVDYWVHCRYWLEGYKIDRGYGFVRTNLDQTAFQKKAYYSEYGWICFDDMITDFKKEYVPRKEKESLRRFDDSDDANNNRKKDVLLSFFSNRDGFYKKYGINPKRVKEKDLAELLGVSRQYYTTVRNEYNKNNKDDK